MNRSTPNDQLKDKVTSKGTRPSLRNDAMHKGTAWISNVFMNMIKEVSEYNMIREETSNQYIIENA